MSFAGRYGPWAIVTGAGQGIGAAFARELTERGVGVVLVDRDPALVTERAAELDGSRGIVADLADASAPDRIVAEVDAIGLEIGLLVSNAALSYQGKLVAQGTDAAVRQLDVNCRAPLLLVHTLLPRLVARGRGGIILLASLSAMRGAPIVAGYAATKAWNLILAESLWDEVRPDGVDVLAVVPGSTRTPGWLASNPQESLGTANLMDPHDVAIEALDALGSVPSIVPGEVNRSSEAFMASLDRVEAIRMMGEVMRAMYPSEGQDQ